jgi:hypothetical protein
MLMHVQHIPLFTAHHVLAARKLSGGQNVLQYKWQSD